MTQGPAVVEHDAGEPERKPPLRARSGRAVELPEYLPARMLNEFTYCPRLFFYEWVEGLFAHSSDTVEGSLRHEKLGEKPESLPPAGSEAPVRARSVTLSSDTLHIIATIDLVEGEHGLVSPVDYKKGRPRDGDEGPEAWPADRAQLCAQALILRDSGYRCNEAVAYYSATKQRVRIPIDEALAGETALAVGAARALAERGEIPPPLVDSPKCPRCSLVGICLPDETTLCEQMPGLEPDPQLSLFPNLDGPPDRLLRAATPEPEVVRRLLPARDDLRPLYITGHGLTVGKSGEVLQVRGRDKPLQEIRLNEISQVNLFGNVQLTAPALQGLCWAEKPIAHFSAGGWFYGLTRGMELKNVFLRRDQFRLADDPHFCLHVARRFVASKIRNQRTLLQRNHVEPPVPVLRQLKGYAEQAAEAASIEQLLGIEGTAARLYFRELPGMIKTGDDTSDHLEGDLSFDFEGRNRRPPRDPINALLSFAYALLAKDLTIICQSVGFDPFIGFFHQPRFGRPALALDLMEEFRPIVADSVVLSAVNTRMVTPRDFVRAGPAVALNASGRKGFMRAYEQRMDALVTHPLFGYRVNYRRVLEIQTRLLGRVITGELAQYGGFETR